MLGEGEGLGDGLAETDGDTLLEGEGLGLAENEKLGDGLAETDGETDRDPIAETDGLGDDDGETETDGLTETDGEIEGDGLAEVDEDPPPIGDSENGLIIAADCDGEKSAIFSNVGVFVAATSCS